jgi:hypothetical protein
MAFPKGNPHASAGGRARAAALSPEQRAEIARKARAGNVARNFGGDDQAQREYLAQLGLWNYEQQVGRLPGGYGRGVQEGTRHPGKASEWYARYKGEL